MPWPKSLYKRTLSPSQFHSFSLISPLLHPRSTNLSSVPPELANSQQIKTLEDQSSLELVRRLYEALSCRDVDTVQRLLTPDIEWWFHGPPCHQRHLMQLLTGGEPVFSFNAISATAIGSIVLVEGFDPENKSVSWVHAWTVSDGVITQIREYFNTSLTVARFEDSDSASTSSNISLKLKNKSCIHWESKLSGESVPGLVLAI